MTEGSRGLEKWDEECLFFPPTLCEDLSKRCSGTVVSFPKIWFYIDNVSLAHLARVVYCSNRCLTLTAQREMTRLSCAVLRNDRSSSKRDIARRMPATQLLQLQCILWSSWCTEPYFFLCDVLSSPFFENQYRNGVLGQRWFFFVAHLLLRCKDSERAVSMKKTHSVYQIQKSNSTCAVASLCMVPAADKSKKV